LEQVDIIIVISLTFMIKNAFFAVIWLPIGAWDVKHVIEQGFQDECFEFNYHILETAMNALKECKSTHSTVILDIAELSYSKVTHMKCMFWSFFVQLHKENSQLLIQFLK